MTRYGVIFIAILLLTAAVINPTARADQPSEYEVKAAFLYNFAKFIQWPDSTLGDRDAPFKIGVLGDNSFGDLLETTIGDKKINDRNVVIATVRNIEAAHNFHIVFISSSEKKRLFEIFTALRGKRVLTVGEAAGFAKSGGMINFYEKGNKIRFEINNRAAREAGLIISSRLLKLARVIEE